MWPCMLSCSYETLRVGARSRRDLGATVVLVAAGNGMLVRLPVARSHCALPRRWLLIQPLWSGWRCIGGRKPPESGGRVSGLFCRAGPPAFNRRRDRVVADLGTIVASFCPL